MEPESSSPLRLLVKWGDKEFDVYVDRDESVGDLKVKIMSLTNVVPARQKFIGLYKGHRLPEDTATMQKLGVQNNKRFMMLGTAEENSLKQATSSADVGDSVINDLDWDFVPDHEQILNVLDNRKKLLEIASEREFTIINPPRPGRKLLVLDLDYTLFDLKSPTKDWKENCRPFLDEFMTAVYPHYDIVIWSQTSWSWLEMKCTEMGLLTNPKYCVSFVLDKTFMFKVTSKSRSGETRTHEVKALEVIWNKMSCWNSRNTIHIDDLGRNFALNPQNGLKIKPFKNAHELRSSDLELLFLAQYLVKISSLDDLSALKHEDWKKYLADHP